MGTLVTTFPPLPNSSPVTDSNFAKWLIEERHLSESTVETKIKNIRRLRKKVNIWNMKAVKRFIVGSDWGNNYKTILEYAYLDWCRFNRFNYVITKYPKETKIP